MDDKYIEITQEWHRKGFESRQAEIDELQNKLDDIVDLVCNNTPDYRIDDMIQEILKGSTP